MAYCTYCQYVNYLGEPDFSTSDFGIYAAVASDLIDQLTHFAIQNIGFTNLPTLTQTLVMKATAMQTLFIYESGGVASLGSTASGGFTVGKVTVNDGGSSASANQTRGSVAISPMALSLLEQTGLLNPSVPLGWWSVC